MSFLLVFCEVFPLSFLYVQNDGKLVQSGLDPCWHLVEHSIAFTALLTSSGSLFQKGCLRIVCYTSLLTAKTIEKNTLDETRHSST